MNRTEKFNTLETLKTNTFFQNLLKRNPRQFILYSVYFFKFVRLILDSPSSTQTTKLYRGMIPNLSKTIRLTNQRFNTVSLKQLVAVCVKTRERWPKQLSMSGRMIFSVSPRSVHFGSLLNIIYNHSYSGGNNWCVRGGEAKSTNIKLIRQWSRRANN